jgi:hypothetical protein
MKCVQLGMAALLVSLTGCSSTEDNGNPAVDNTGDDSTSATTSAGATNSVVETGNAGTGVMGTAMSAPTTVNNGNSTAPGVEPAPSDFDPGSSTSIDTPTTVMTSGSPSASTNTTAASSQANDTSSADTSVTSGTDSSQPPDDDVVDLGADDKFSFFVTSYYHLALLSGSEDGFGGDLRYNGAATGLEGADAICQEIARRVSFGHRTWRAYLSTSTVNAIDRVGNGPWYDFLGVLVAESAQGLISGEDRQPGGCCAEGTYDEMGLFHDGSTDQNNDGIDDDDHDTMTATQPDGTYSGFSCEDWTSTTAVDPEASGGMGGGQAGGGDQAGGGFGGGGFGGGGIGFLSGGIMMGHSWPAGSGRHWATAHAGHACAPGTNFIQDGAGDPATVGGGGGYGGFYCFALSE